MNSNHKQTKQGILDLHGANCASCAHAVEHNGRKMKGVKNIRVDAGEKKIYVDFDGDESVLDKIKEIVSKLGYSAEIAPK